MGKRSRIYWNWRKAQGLVPSAQTLTDAAQQYGNALLLGTTAPGMVVTPSNISVLHGLDIPSVANNVMAGRLKIGYKPPVVAARSFEADYPGGALSDGTGTLTQTMDGQPITAPYVVGRREVQQPDIALTPQGVNEISEGLLGTVPAPGTAREMGGDAGRLARGINPETGNLEFSLRV